MPSQYLKERYPNTRIWITSNKSKNNIIQRLILDFNTKNIKILENDFICEELDFYTSVWKDGLVRHGASGGKHDDGVMSLAICNYHRDKVQTAMKAYPIPRNPYAKTGRSNRQGNNPL